MKYDNIIEGKFIKRLNRFIAEVELKGEVVQVHVKNTGRCKELFIPGVTVYLEPAKNPERKTKYSLIAVVKENYLINIDSQVPNGVVEELLKEVMAYQQGQAITVYSHNIDLIMEFSARFPGLSYIKREKTYNNSRFDIYYELVSGTKGFIEVKGVTLEDDQVARFPDAPTERGSKHIGELMDSIHEGYVSYVFFLIQLSPVKWFEGNRMTDPKFCQTLSKAYKEGVTILCYDSLITENSIVVNQPIPFRNVMNVPE